MKFLPAFVLVVTAAASVVAGAETVISDQAAQERRDRNFDEALARYRAIHGTPDGATASAAPAKDGVREKTHRAAQSVRDFTHRQADKARDFGSRHRMKSDSDAKTSDSGAQK